MRESDRAEDLDELEELLVVPPRKGGSGALVPAIALIVVALGFLGVRASLSDWQGIEAKRPVLAKAAPARGPAPTVPKKPVSKPAPPQPGSAKPADAAPAEVAKVDPMTEIAQEAERKRQEKDELERLKDKAANELAQAPRRALPPRPLADPLRAQILRRRQMQAFARHRQAMDRMIAQAEANQRRNLDEWLARERQSQAEFAARFGFGAPPPGMPPFPGVPVPPPPVPAPPPNFFEGPPRGFANPAGRQVRRQNGTFVMPDGGQGRWESTIIIQGFDNGLGR